MIPCSVPNDQTSDDAYKAGDVMFASVSNQGRTAVPVELAFSHLMSKLNVNITPGAGVGDINSVRILNVICEGQLTVDTGDVSVSSSTSATSIAMSNDGAACFPAQTITGNLLSIETDQGTATYSVPAGKTFEAGKQYTFNLSVNLREVGMTNQITDWTDDGVVTLKVDQRRPAGLEAVDLGLYEGGASTGKKLLWANMNLGATSVTDYGDYFAWGEVTGHSGADGYSFLPGDYSYIGIDDHVTDVYMYNSTDGLTVLRPPHDAANAHWGDGWRMPTKEEYDALLTLSKEWTTQDGVNGHRFTGNDHSIFLPAAGFCHSTGDWIGIGTAGYYSSSKRDMSTSGLGVLHALNLFFNEDDAYSSERLRYYGLSVRPVRTD